MSDLARAATSAPAARSTFRSSPRVATSVTPGIVMLRRNRSDAIGSLFQLAIQGHEAFSAFDLADAVNAEHLLADRAVRPHRPPKHDMRCVQPIEEPDRHDM